MAEPEETFEKSLLNDAHMGTRSLKDRNPAKPQTKLKIES
jgi:hypothetical protein